MQTGGGSCILGHLVAVIFGKCSGSWKYGWFPLRKFAYSLCPLSCGFPLFCQNGQLSGCLSRDIGQFSLGKVMVSQQVKVSLAPDVITQLQAKAKADGDSLSQVVRKLVLVALK